MLEEILIAGFGGQGVLMMGRLLAESAMQQGLNATWLPSYGPEMRGGTANCIVAFSDDEIGSPLAATYDAVIAMNQPSLEKFQDQVKPGGTLIVNSSIIPITSNRSDIDVSYVQSNDIAEKASGTGKSANAVTLGALHAVRPRLQVDMIESAIRSVFAPKGDNIVEGNIKALHAGIEAMAQPATPTGAV